MTRKFWLVLSANIIVMLVALQLFIDTGNYLCAFVFLFQGAVAISIVTIELAVWRNIRMKHWTRNMRVLHILAQHPEGLYGSDLRRIIPGWFVGFWIYDTLEALVKSDLVYEILETPIDDRMLPRTRHFITPVGLALVEATHG